MNKQESKSCGCGKFQYGTLVVKAGRRPQTGETLMGEEFGMFIGGKGSNQAIAAARLGANVTMIGRLGADLFGDNVNGCPCRGGVSVRIMSSETRRLEQVLRLY